MKNPLKIGDVTFRDAQQSLLATRMSTEDITGIAEEMDKAGFYAIDATAGFLFEICIRYLNEDPWERIRLLKKLMPNTPLRMTLRGRSLAGWRNYPDDVITAFYKHAAEAGIDIFRLYDSLNDERNFESCIKAIKECGKQIQAEIIYSLTEEKLGGPVYTIDYYVNKSLVMQDMGADSICLTDSPGILSPDDAYNLTIALKKALKVPILMHSHYLSGMASMSYLKSIEAGVDIIDTSLAPLAMRASLPAVEPIVLALKGTPRDTGLDLAHLRKLGQYFENILPKYRDFLDTTRMAAIDTSILMHQMPGGMTTTLLAQLKEANAQHRINEVYEECGRVRRDLGYPPLVTPISQIVGVQAVQNVLAGRYKMISRQVQDYVFGLYGKTPAPIDPEVQKIALKNYEGGQTPITDFPTLEPELDKAREATRDIARDIGDVLLYALYSADGMRFLKWKYGLETPPPELKPKTLEDIRREDDIIARVKAGKLVEKKGD
ncbi:pyruvate carboxylase subunit B [Chloroflexota bacterium]